VSTSSGSGPLAPKVAQLRRQVRLERLDIGLLPVTARRWALVGLAVIVAAAVFIVAIGAGAHLPGGSVPVPGGHTAASQVPRLLIVFEYLALGLIGAVVTVAGRHDGWRAPAVPRLLVALVGAAVSAGCAGLATPLTAFPGAHPEVAKILGWTGFGLACVLAVLPRWAFGSRHEAAALLGSSPFLLVLVAYLLAPGGSTVVRGVHARDVLASPVITTAGDLGIAVGLLLVWGVLASVRLSRGYGLGIARAVERVSWLLPVLLLAKVGWMIAGYLGALTRWTGGAGDAWTLSRQDGVVGWGYAIVIVAAGTYWLVYRPRERRTEEVGGEGWVFVVVLGLASTFVVYSLLTLLVEITLPWPWASVPAHLLSAADRVAPPGIRAAWPVVITVAATPLGAALLLRLQRLRHTASYVLLLAVWGLPAAAWTAWVLVENEAPPFNNTSLATIDTVVTGALIVLAVGWWTGRQRAVSPSTLVVALVMFTLIGHPGFLLPASWGSGNLFYLSLVYPVAWLLVFRAGTLNDHAPNRPARVLGALGLSGLLLVLAAVDVAVGVDRPGVANGLDSYLHLVGRTFLMVPLAALLVAELAASKQVSPGRRSASG